MASCIQVLGGADLFLQGLIVPEQGLGTFSAGDLMLASIPQNQYPFAIGVLETSSADIAKHGLKGKGLKLLHHYPDMLWALGDKSVPDPSFTATRIFPQVKATLHLCGEEIAPHARVFPVLTCDTLLEVVCSSRPPSQTHYCL